MFYNETIKSGSIAGGEESASISYEYYEKEMLWLFVGYVQLVNNSTS